MIGEPIDTLRPVRSREDARKRLEALMARMEDAARRQAVAEALEDARRDKAEAVGRCAVEMALFGDDDDDHDD